MAPWRIPVALLTVLAASVVPSSHIRAAGEAVRVEFEDALVRVQRISLGPGERFATQDRSDGVLICLTADLDGRMPRADALWQPAGSQPLENRAATRFEGLFVELKASPAGTPAPVVPELAPREWSWYGTSYYRRDHRASSLIDNDRVTVSGHRIAPLQWTEDGHTHPRGAVFVYLRGGEVTGSSALAGFHRTRRGSFDVLPANQFHTLFNGGNDPIDLVAIWPK